MPERPAGVVAFLFTDLEGSTRLWERHPDVMPAVYARHDRLLRVAAVAHGGRVYKVIGDAIQIAFPTAPAAVAAALAAQQALLAVSWETPDPLRVRMALHAGEVAPQPDGDYRAPALNRLGRLLAAGHGGQVLLSRVIAELARNALPAGTELRDLGEHRFRDLTPERVYQLVAPGLVADFPPLRGMDQHRHNLPPPATLFVGRATDVATVRALLARPEVRLVTLTGPGGTGKTRLALQVASELVETLADGVWWVPLAALTDPTLVVPAIAQAIGVRETADQPPAESLASFLESRDTLLVLDNLEQVIDAASDVAALMASCPRLTLLVTSRAPLRVSGEREMPVPPLALPPRPGVGSRPTPPAALAEFESVRLFAERARAVRPDFVVTAENAAAIAAICQRLDGLPLAIELAAARSRLLPPDALLARLHRRLPLLAAGPRDVPARQQTLRGAIAWSYDLLDPVAQSLFARLAVFSSGATIAAIEAVCADEEPISVLDVLDTLTEQSLLRSDEGPDGEPRLTMLETIREFALERLAERADASEVTRRHAAYYLDLAEEAEPRLSGAEQAVWLARLEAEHDNLRAALTELEREENWVDALRLAGALARFWWVRGHLSEGRRRLERVLARGAGEPAADRARALDGAGVLAEAQGDSDRAEALHVEALALWRRLGDRLGCARSLENLGIIEQHDRGNHGRARELLDEALTLYRAVGDRPGIASALSNLGDVALAEEDYDRAAALFDEALAMARTLGDVQGVAIGLTNLGALAFFREDHERAGALYEESLPLWRELGDIQGITLVLGNLGEARQHQGDLARATALYDDALSLARELGDKQGIAFALSHLARVARAEGDPTRAAALFVEGLDLCHQVGELPRLAECLEGLAGVLGSRGEGEQAVLLFGAADAVRERAAAPLAAVHRADYERDLAAARASLDDAIFAATWAAGRALSIDAAIAEAGRSAASADAAGERGVVPRSVPAS